MTANAVQTTVIVGAGHAAGELASALRQEGFTGRILMIGDESHLPYQRPPLSKAYLSGQSTADALYLKPQSTYDRAQIEILVNTRVESIDRAAKRVVLADGRTIQYDKLALTTGGRVRRLPTPGADTAEKMSNFHYIRNIDDIDRLRHHFDHGLRLVIIGGGYIGLEVAAVARKRGLHVTVLEALPRVLARVTAPELSAFYERIHREAGVDVRTSVQVTGFEFDASGDAVSAVTLADGPPVPADVIVAGIGLVPNVELAQAAGLTIENGIVVDEFTQTSDPDIYSAGDCTNHPSALYGRRIRLESVPNAVEQARTLAAAICGKRRPYNAVPWFWSDQYNLKLQMVGLSQGYDQFVLRGSTSGTAFSAFYLKEGKVIAADAVNRAPDFMTAKRLVADGVVVDPEVLADESVPLKSLLPSAAATAKQM
jgi:3-phenylpropionate/trans-cinnamate dioxygenase ferredoxin reductase subunit